MFVHTEKFSNPAKLNFIYLFLLLWFGFLAWVMAWPPEWHDLPVLLCFGYIAFRIVFEQTINRPNIPTMATGFLARRKIAGILESEAGAHKEKAFSVVDLGSGRGELARCIAKRIPTAKVSGVELARVPCLQASIVQRLFGPRNLSYQCGSFWAFDCSNVDAVVLYLAPVTVQTMGEKLHRELKPGSLVISHAFPLLGKWTPEEVLTFLSPLKETIYIYRKA